jgi:hypothetical protein
VNDRAYLKDIKSISSSYLGFDEEVFTIETYREGIYDYLPEGLFIRLLWELPEKM